MTAKKYSTKKHKKYANKTPHKSQKPQTITLWVGAIVVFAGFLFWPASSWHADNLPVKYAIPFPPELHVASAPETSAITIATQISLWHNENAPITMREREKYTESWRMDQGAYAGFALQNLLNAKNIASTPVRGTNMSDQQRIEKIQDTISQGTPLLLMGGQKNVPSYMLVVGFNRVAQTFDVYDPTIAHDVSNITYDNNDETSGNITYDNSYILDFWDEGGLYLLYNYYGISIATPVAKPVQ